MLVYSVTETVDIASRLWQYRIVLEICLHPNTEAAPKLTILDTSLEHTDPETVKLFWGPSQVG